MPLARQTMLILSVGCGIIVVSLGITAAVLGAKGYFGFEEPCIGIYDFSIGDLDTGSDPDNAEEASGIFGLLDGVAEAAGFGSISAYIPTQVSMTINLTMEVNNTNPYDMDYEQSEEGVISIPDDAGGAASDSGGESAARQGTTAGEGLVVGTWELPKGTLKKRKQNLLPVSIDTTIQISDMLGLGMTFAANGPMAFEVEGNIEGEGWVPGVSGKVSFLCMARLENTAQAATGMEDATIRCRHKTRLGRRLRELQEISGEYDMTENLWDLLGEDDVVDEACLV